MCQQCFDKPIQFSSQAVYKEFNALLNEKLKEPDGLKHTGGEERSATQGIQIYTCGNCGAIWWLSVPDKDTTGFFIRDADFLTYLKNGTRYYKLRYFFLVLLIILMIVLAVFYQR